MATGEAEPGRRLIEFVGSGDFESARNLIETSKSELVDFADEDGMSVLMHAVYRGDVKMCRYLLEKGVDVNRTQHTHQYTALMFAALSGSAEVTQLLLEAGAVRDKENDIGKSASQLAGFVGHHQCVSVISSFIPLCVLEPYTVPQGSVLKL
jgi:ankyrin repeat protein